MDGYETQGGKSFTLELPSGSVKYYKAGRIRSHSRAINRAASSARIPPAAARLWFQSLRRSSMVSIRAPGPFVCSFFPLLPSFESRSRGFALVGQVLLRCRVSVSELRSWMLMFFWFFCVFL
ncbi:hypothetical protein C4D60_Mb01t15970 [Musa balbisiana]|uniref:Uncharacterized protein n=1 Tax=Musa balbisiana TaxID=52838 RepID=A0A4S8JNX4_MUSBA|nr:hypothetical protein C4D60_Mb01t15970 [Musa balbisiana]